MLLEGSFPSAFFDALPQAIKSDPNIGYKRQSNPTAMIVVGDGDIIRNGIMPAQEGFAPLPLGYDRYAKSVLYDNKEFLLNAVDYLLDDTGVIELRNKNLKINLLDKKRAFEERTFWQFINIALPLFILTIFGCVFHYLRKRKYS